MEQSPRKPEVPVGNNPQALLSATRYDGKIPASVDTHTHTHIYTHTKFVDVTVIRSVTNSLFLAVWWCRIEEKTSGMR